MRFGESAKFWILPLAVAAIWCGMILFVHRDSPRTLVSAHGLLHAAIAEPFANEATRPPFATPPENPLFAGTPLPYYYFFHATGAQLARLLGIDVIHAFELLVLVAAVAVVLIGFALGRWNHLYTRSSYHYGIAFALLFFAGCNPQGPLLLLVRWLRDGSAALEDRGQYLWGLVHPVNGAMRIGDYWGALGPLGSFFFNVTARPLALASLALVILMLSHALTVTRRPQLSALLGIALSMALCTLWSPLLGLASAGALAAAIVLQATVFDRPALRKRRSAEIDRETPSSAVQQAQLRELDGWMYRGRWLAVAALLAGAALAWPWYRHLFGSASGQIDLVFNAKRALGVLASCWLLVLLTRPRFSPIRIDAIDVTRTLLIAGALLAIPTAFVALPVGNEDNFLHAAIVCFAAVAARWAAPDLEIGPDPPPGSARVVTERGGGRRLLLLHLFFLPSFVLLVVAYTNRPPIPIAFEHGALRREPKDGREARLYDWLRAQTPANAVVVQDPGKEGRTCTGNTSELPAFSGRALFTDYRDHYLVAPHPDAGRRVAIAESLAAGESLADDDARYLAALRRPILVVTYDAGAATIERLRVAHGEPSFSADGISVFAWRPRE